MKWIIAFAVMEAIAIPAAVWLENRLGPKAKYLDTKLRTALKRG